MQWIKEVTGRKGAPLRQGSRQRWFIIGIQIEFSGRMSGCRDRKRAVYPPRRRRIWVTDPCINERYEFTGVTFIREPSNPRLFPSGIEAFDAAAYRGNRGWVERSRGRKRRSKVETAEVLKPLLLVPGGRGNGGGHFYLGMRSRGNLQIVEDGEDCHRLDRKGWRRGPRGRWS